MVWILFVLFITISLNALYVAAEFATVSARRSSIQHLAAKGHKTARALLPILENSQTLDRYVATCQIGITLSSIVLGAFGQAALTIKAAPVAQAWIGLSREAALSLSAVVVLVILTTFQMILGELVPKSLSLQFPNRIALLTYQPMRWSMAFLSWFIVVLNGSGIALLNIIGVRQSPHRHIHSPSELEILIAQSRDGGALEPDEHERLKKALRLSTKTAGEISVPRTRVVAIDATASAEDVFQVMTESPYTRFPVYRGSHDNIVGMLHAKDVTTTFVKHGRLPAIETLLRPLPAVPSTVNAERVLAMLRKRRAHQAVVIDERGGVAGIITLTDVLSEVVGAIGDEFKFGQPSAERLPDGRVRIPGQMRLDEAQYWLGTLWQGDCHTVAGKVIEAAGKVPIPGDQISIDGVEIEVEHVEHNSIVSVIAVPLVKTNIEDANE